MHILIPIYICTYTKPPGRGSARWLQIHCHQERENFWHFATTCSSQQTRRPQVGWRPSEQLAHDPCSSASFRVFVYFCGVVSQIGQRSDSEHCSCKVGTTRWWVISVLVYVVSTFMLFTGNQHIMIRWNASRILVYINKFYLKCW